jgi:hypothetical protein
MLHARFLVPLVCVTLAASAAAAQVPEGWQKVSGVPETALYSGVADGLDPGAPDRQNSYAWSMEVLGDHLYVGTNRNVFGLMIQVTGRYDLVGPGKPVPLPTDQRSRIYRMALGSEQWERVFVGDDTGYRMMKTFEAEGRPPVLYVGGSGVGWCRLLALDGMNQPVEVFRTEVPGQFLSIRAIAEHCTGRPRTPAAPRCSSRRTPCTRRPSASHCPCPGRSAAVPRLRTSSATTGRSTSSS